MKNRFYVSSVFALTVLFWGLLAGTASAANYVVTKTTDSNDGVCNADCSLREAVEKANQTGAADIITFDSTVFANPTTIDLFLGEIQLGTDLTIVGTGARRLTVRQTLPGERVFTTPANGSTGTLIALGITGGNIASAGGGMLVSAQSNWTLLEIFITGNSAISGGGIYNEGTLTIRASLFQGNAVTGSGTGGCIDLAIGTVNISNTTIVSCSASNGGGIYLTSGTLVLNNVTISSNTSGFAGGIRADGFSRVRMRNTIVSDNNCTGCGNDENDDVVGVGNFVSNGNNLIKATPAAGTGFTDGVINDKVGVDPQLLPITNNGGVIDTQAFLPTSPARDAGNNCVIDST